jgi:DNA polymerase-3 subunit alpha
MSLSKHTGYKTPFPVGVKLPEIKIEKKYYEEVSCKESEDNYQFLRKLCFKRLQQKGIDKLDNAQVYYSRLTEELAIFQDLGFVDYILLNWDIINFCVENDIPTGAGRGSAAGSLVLFIIGVTHIDPIEYGLFFERFVSKSRARKIEHEGETFLDGSLLADVDNDISYDRRAEVIKYIEEKYKGKSSKILTLAR